MSQSFYVEVKGVIDTKQGILIMRDAERGKWELPGGRLDKGQPLEAAFLNDIRTELPVARDITLGDVFFVAVGDFEVENNHRLCLSFHKVTATLPENFNLNGEDDQFAFVTKDNIDEYNLYSADKEAIERYQKV